MDLRKCAKNRFGRSATLPGAEGSAILNNNVNRDRRDMPSYMQASCESPFDLTQPNLGLAVNSPINLLTAP